MSPLRTVALLAMAVVAILLPADAFAQEMDPHLRTVKDASADSGKRVKAAKSLEEKSPDLLVEAFLEMAHRKEPFNTEFLAQYVLGGETRLLRLAAVHAAMGCDPEGALKAFVLLADAEDEKAACRAIEAVGYLYAPLKSKDTTILDHLVGIANGTRILPAIEATRALSRCGDRRLAKTFQDLVVSAPDDHVRKHAVWGLQDQLGTDRKVEKLLIPLKGRKGDEGANAAEGLEILKDKEELPFTWNVMGLKNLPDIWGKRSPSGRPEVIIGDKITAEKVEGWIEHLSKMSPAWAQLLGTVATKIQFRPASEDRIYDPAKRMMFLTGQDVSMCETNWQGAYVISRNACMALGALLEEPSANHRGWEPSYVEMHTFYLADREHPPGNLTEFVEDNVKRKPWR